jgi:hypothetical protein
MVDELCRRPGVTPWDWKSGPVDWPPGKSITPDSTASQVHCSVAFSRDRLEIHLEAPRQLSLDAVLGTISAEYRRAKEDSVDYPQPTPETPYRVAEEVGLPYGTPSMDPMLAALLSVAAKGATAKELEKLTGESAYRVRKRLKELVDASLISKIGSRYYHGSLQVAASQRSSAKRPRRKRATAPSKTLTLF